MNEWARFGDPEEFAIGLRWVTDDAWLARLPAGHGWSMGELEITVAGVNVTASSLRNERQNCVRWYLSPMLKWFASNWAELLHEEQLPWPGRRRTGPAAIALPMAADEWADASDERGQATYERVQGWYKRHGLRSAATGGVFPDVFLRRRGDDIEVSWSGTAPEFTPRGLVFESGSGCSFMPVHAVAKPIWQALQWAKRWAQENQSEAQAGFRKDMESLVESVAALDSLQAERLAGRHAAVGLIDVARQAFQSVSRLDLFDSEVRGEIPFVEQFSPAVAMFGGVSPELAPPDVERLRDSLVSANGGSDSERLAALVSDREGEPLGVPHLDGQRFAADLLDELELPRPGERCINVEAICDHLGIDVVELHLDTDSIRGAAFAGDNFSPRVLVNPTHPFNGNESGRRFTLAHELCHVLFDRTRARRIAHASGDWAAPGIEQRANAFAAYLLMPRELVVSILGTGDSVDDGVHHLAAQLEVNQSALIPHLFNLGLIDSAQRHRLIQGG